MSEKQKETKTYCYNCENETNQAVLYYDVFIEGVEIVSRNDEGDQRESFWTPVGNIWSLSKCLGCEKVNFKHVVSSSLDKSNDKIFYFPRKYIRQIPPWFVKLPIKYLPIAHEVYAAVNERLNRLSMAGIRTLLDIFIVSKVGDAGSFKQKLEKLIALGVITKSKASILETAIDAGSATVHRGFSPDQETIFQVLDIVENLLHSEIVDRDADQIKQKIPRRK